MNKMKTTTITFVALLCFMLFTGQAQACCYICGYKYTGAPVNCCSTSDECTEGRAGCSIEELLPGYFAIRCSGGYSECNSNVSFSCCGLYPGGKCCIGSYSDPCCTKKEDPCCGSKDPCCGNPDQCCPEKQGGQNSGMQNASGGF